MSKRPIDFTQINETALAHLQNFAAARIAIAKEDQRHKEVLSPLKKQLEALHENRMINIKAGLSRDEAIIQFSTVEVENAIRKENDLHKEIMKPLNNELKSTYGFMEDGLYSSYKLKIEEQKRGEYLKHIGRFLSDMGIIEVSQSALCKLAEQISDRIGVTISKSKVLLENGVFTCALKKPQFNKLFMSVFCDILVINGVMECSFD